MKRFHFTLARVRDFRRQQAEVEEIKLQKVNSEREALDAEAARLENEAAGARSELMVTGSAEAQELVAADLYLRHVANLRKRHEQKIANWQARVAKQRSAVIEARRRVRLMEKLEAKQRAEWQAAVDQEQENLASELFLARWTKPRD